MTTLDDAAERPRKQCEQIFQTRDGTIHCIRDRGHSGQCMVSLITAGNLVREATEAAAKKCDELAQVPYAARDRYHNQACDECAAAIRGKSG